MKEARVIWSGLSEGDFKPFQGMLEFLTPTRA